MVMTPSVVVTMSVPSGATRAQQRQRQERTKLLGELFTMSWFELRQRAADGINMFARHRPGSERRGKNRMRCCGSSTLCRLHSRPLTRARRPRHMFFRNRRQFTNARHNRQTTRLQPTRQTPYLPKRNVRFVKRRDGSIKAVHLSDKLMHLPEFHSYRVPR